MQRPVAVMQTQPQPDTDRSLKTCHICELLKVAELCLDQDISNISHPSGVDRLSYPLGDVGEDWQQRERTGISSLRRAKATPQARLA